MNIKEMALRLALQQAVSEASTASYKRARTEAEPVFAKAYREMGTESLGVWLPGGPKIAKISIKGGKVTYRLHEAELLAFVERHQPSEVEEFIDPVEATRPEVLELIREHRPDILRRRVRPVWHEAKAKEAAENGGYLVDPESGEKVKVADVTVHPPSGEFAFTPDKGKRGEVLAALRDPALAEQAGVADLLSLLGVDDGAAGESGGER
ncbi:hypothetical protein [Actinomadura sp. K4S16]|uniref:hypothetical protein n=1 Tax=Actinomadura sp. K4S16 TaxID=1316147 RepID=UPI0011F02F57|nr:hypothetical protein [Actinomadura sp. K4S16]